MDKIHAMKLFLRVADLESFSLAGQALGLPKASVSRQIHALEESLGIRLLHRTTRRVQLTQEGMIYYERARDLLSNLEELDTLFCPDAASVSGRLRVDIPVWLARVRVLPNLSAFLQQHPGIELDLSSSNRRVDVVREDFDCAIRLGEQHESGLTARPLGQLTLINCASPDYLARFGYPQAPECLADHALIHFAQTPGARPQGFAVYDGSQTRWIRTGGMLTVNSMETYHTACLAGLGIIQTPRASVKEALRSGGLVEVLPQFRAAPVPVTLMYPPRRNLSRRVNLFMEWLTTLLGGWVDEQ